MNMLKNFVVCS